MALTVLLRVAYAVPILLGVSIISFSLIYMASASPVELLLPADASQAMIDQIRQQYGFDRPIYMQYLGWLSRALHGDLGVSVYTGEAVGPELLDAFWNTALLAIPAMIIALCLGTLLGAVAAFKHDTWIDKAVSALSICGVSFPQYWTAIVAVIIFSVELGWFPPSGMAHSGSFPATITEARHLVLPVLTLALIPLGIVSRMVRSTFLEILSQEFFQALRARGLRFFRIVHHVGKNSLPPLLAVAVVQFGYLLGGSILTETVFNWPGIGQLMNSAIFRRDIPVLQAGVLLLGFTFVLLNLLVDLLQVRIDPRLRV